MIDKDEILNNCHIDGRPAKVGEIWKMGIDALQDACAAFYEIETEEACAASVMCDAALVYATNIYKGNEFPRLLVDLIEKENE